MKRHSFPFNITIYCCNTGNPTSPLPSPKGELDNCVSSRILYVSFQFITDSLGNPKLILLVGGSYLKTETWNCQAGYVTTNPIHLGKRSYSPNQISSDIIALTWLYQLEKNKRANSYTDNEYIFESSLWLSECFRKPFLHRQDPIQKLGNKLKNFKCLAFT